MKKIFTLLNVFFFLMVGIVNAQQLSNLGFENFKTDDYNNNVGVTPVGWYASNLYKNVGITVTKQLVFEDANGRTGKCVLMQNGEAGAMGIKEVSPSWISLGKPWSYINGLKTGSATAGTDGGIQFAFRPDTMVVWIKRLDNNGENAHAVIYLWKGTSKGDSYKSKDGGCTSTTHYDEESDIRQAYDANECGTTTLATQIAEGMWRSNKTYSNWTQIKVPITYLSNDVPEKMNIIFSAANYPNKRDNNVNNGSKLYVDDLKFIYSSAVHEILLNNRSMAGFDPSQTSYVYTLGSNVNTIPSITLKRSGRILSSSEYTIYPAPIGGDTRIVVNAEDGSSSTTYTIKFVNELSVNARPSDIKYNGISLPNFNPYVVSYNVELPYGTTQIPSIEVVYAESGQSHSVVNPTSLPGKAVVTVLAPNTDYSQQYTINYTIGAFTDNTITGIMVNGKPVKGFSPTNNNYVVELPIGTTEAPVITWTTDYPNEQTIVLDNNGISGGATITVTPKGTSLSRTYRLRFVVSASTYSYLNAINVDGSTIDNFSPSQLSYTVTLPLGITAMPVITWEAGDEFQQIVYENNGIDNVSKITVTSQSGAVSVYRINVISTKSSNSSLQNIFIDGVALTDFNPDTYQYTYSLPVGTQIMPDITWTAGDEYQNVSFVNGGINGISRIVVTSQDGNVSTYQISFVVEQSSNVSLNSILVDGVELADFDSEVLDYNVVLPQGTTELPVITYVSGDAYQTIRKIEGGINGVTRIIVKSQSGETRVYTITFSVDIDVNNFLAGIKIGDNALANFHPDTLIYYYELPSGTISLPQISVVKGSDSQRINIQKGGVNGATAIVVTAENGDEKIYTVNFSVRKSENAFLGMIYIDGDSLAGFSPEILDYRFEIPVSSTSCPTVSVDKGVGQSVFLTLPKINGVARIEVKPENGSSNVYTIDFHYPQSSNTTLGSIMIDGVEIENFDSDIRNYSVLVAASDLSNLKITYTKAEASQVVYLQNGSYSTPAKIFVKAENGEVGCYSITLNRTLSSNSKLSAILLNGSLINGFESDVTHYIYMMDVDATVAPKLTYTKMDEGQKVVLTAPSFEGVARIDVVSPDLSDTTVYTIDFTKKLRSNSTLSSIALNGEFIDMQLFDGTDTAVVDWPSEGKAPKITYVKSSPYQFVALADGGLNGSELLVVAEDGSSKEYVIRYNIIKSNKAKLKNIKLLAGPNIWQDIAAFTSVSSYSPVNDTLQVFEFDVTLPWRTTTVPMIQPITNFGQKVKVNYGLINGLTTIEVVSEDGTETNIYSVNFVVEKSTVSTLDAVYADGSLIAGFDSNTFVYNCSLPYGTDNAPVLSWDKAVADDGSFIDEQRIVYFNGGLYKPSTITVFAENGDSSVYVVNFMVEESDLDNALDMIYVNGAPLVGFSPEVHIYDVTLPYGTEEVPTVEVLKKFPSQRIQTVVTGINGEANIFVYANNAVTLYTIRFSENKINGVYLTSAEIDGVAVSGFSSDITTYVVSTTNDNVVWSGTAVAGSEYVIEEQNSGKVVVKVYSLENSDSAVYKFFLHHPSDVIPNADFSSWSSTKYNKAQKPTGWMAPADATDKYKFSIFDTYTTGDEVKNENGVVKLSTIFGTFSISGSVPGMITTGTMKLNLTSAGNSTSSVSGGIKFRNTPDRISVDYKPVASSNISNWRMLLTATGTEGSQNFLYSGSFDNTNTWQNASLDLDFKSVGTVNMINLTLNAANSENANDFGGTALNSKTSEVHFDNVVLYYNSLLSGLSVDGVSIPDFNSNIYSYTDTLDSEYSGYPNLTAVGQVEDQQHNITWLKQSDNNIVAHIASLAEDGSVTNYSVSFYRPNSTVDTLLDLLVDGVKLQDFSADKFTYRYEIPNQCRIAPDITAVAASEHQNITVNTSLSKSVITVTAENGSVNTYTIDFVEQKNNVTALKNIVVNGYDIDFREDKKKYVVSYSNDIPKVSYEKMYDGQEVVYSEGDSVILKVVAQNSTIDNYYICFVNADSVVNTALSMIAINGENINDFDKNNFVYYHELKEPIYSVEFSKDNAKALVETIVSDSIIEISSVYNHDITRYVIHLQPVLGGVASLSDCAYNGSTVEDFIPAQTKYQRFISRDSYADIYVSVSDNASVVADYFAMNDTLMFSFFSKSEDLEKNQTTEFAFIYGKSDSTSLNAINLNGELIKLKGTDFTSDADFDSEVTEYSILLKADSPKMVQPGIPSISVLTKSGQSVDIEQNGINDDSYITVTSESGNSRVYTLSFAAELSSETRLKDIALNYESLVGFSAEQAGYVYEKKSAEENIEVTYQTMDNFQTVNTTVTDSLITLVVTAEDNSVRTYTVEVVYPASAINTIDNIYLDGTPLAGFDKNVNDYFVDLPVGTTSLPTITIVPGADNQQIDVEPGAINDTTSISVIAGDGSENRYNIYFNVLKSQVSTLSMININGNPLEINGVGYTSSSKFNPNVFTYNITLPIGTRVMPDVTFVEGDEYQEVRLVDEQNGVRIYVTAQDTTYKSEYVINYTVLRSQNAQLSSIEVNGVSVPNFSSDKYHYIINLPVGTDIVPEITWTKGDQWQNVYFYPTENVNGTASLVVKAEDSTFVNTYTIVFNRLLSDVDTLAKIFINGVEYSEYKSDVYQYYVELPVGTVSLPLIEWQTGDAYQTVDTVSNGVAGDFIFTVTAENGSVNRYIIHFSLQKSSNASLVMISVAGTPISNFDMDILSYEVLMPYGSYQVPYITWTFAEPNVQRANFIPAASLADTAKIIVTAEDGVSTSEYKVYFTIEKSDNALLKAIYIGGELISTSAKGFVADSDFEPETNVYNIILPYGTEKIPEITYDGMVADYADIIVAEDTVNNSVVITVISQNEMVINEYKLNFTVRLSDNAFLKNLNVKGLVDNFDSLVFTYNITFPIGTKESDLPTKDDVIFEKAEESQSVTVTQSNPKEIVVTVVAEDGLTINAYVITFEIMLSSNTLLSDILINGVSIDNFSPTQFEYTYYLFHGSLIPTLEGVKSEESQIVDVTMGVIDEASYIYVEAEDGSVGEYKVYFMTSNINSGEKPSMEDVKWTPLGNGYYKASSIRDNVTIRIYQTDGLCVKTAPVGLVDPNDDINEMHDGGTVLYFEEKHQCYIYVFVYDNKVVLSGKFIR